MFDMCICQSARGRVGCGGCPEVQGVGATRREAFPRFPLGCDIWRGVRRSAGPRLCAAWRGAPRVLSSRAICAEAARGVGEGPVPFVCGHCRHAWREAGRGGTAVRPWVVGVCRGSGFVCRGRVAERRDECGAEAGGGTALSFCLCSGASPPMLIGVSVLLGAVVALLRRGEWRLVGGGEPLAVGEARGPGQRDFEARRWWRHLFGWGWGGCSARPGGIGVLSTGIGLPFGGADLARRQRALHGASAVAVGLIRRRGAS